MPRKEGMERWLDINFFWYFFVSGRTCLPSMWKSSRCRVRLLTSLPRRLARFLWVSLTWNNTLDLIWALIFDHWISFESDPGCRKPCKHQRSDLFPLCAIHPKGLKSMLENEMNVLSLLYCRRISQPWLGLIRTGLLVRLQRRSIHYSICLKNVSSNLAIDFVCKSYHLCSCFSSECLFLL